MLQAHERDLSPDTGPSRDLPKLTAGTLVAAAGAVAVAQVGLSIPAVINGYINQDLGTTSTQLTWISDAFLVPVTLFELTFGVVGDLFGRKRLLAIGAPLMVVGGLLGFFTPTGGVGVLLTGQVISGIGAAAIFPTSVAMLAAGTHNVKERAHAISIWAAALTGAGFISPVLAGLLARIDHSGGEYASWRYAFLAMAVAGRGQRGHHPRLRAELLRAAGPLAGLARPDHHRGRAVRAAVRRDPGRRGRLGQRHRHRRVRGRRRVPGRCSCVIERRVDRPLIQLDLFSNRIFTVSAVVTVLGMFAYLGTAYATSIRLSAIQEYSPLKTSIGFFCLNVMGVVLFPVSTRVIERYNPGWVLAVGHGADRRR